MEVVVGELRKEDLPSADRLFRVTFGTLFHLSDPMKFYGDADVLSTRWNTDLAAILKATVDGEFVGLQYVAHWGSVGWFGPLAVRPDYWNQGIGSLLMEKTLEVFDGWNVSFSGLTTFPENPKNIAFYQKFGYWPGMLTSKMDARVEAGGAKKTEDWSGFSRASPSERKRFLGECAGITNEVYEGLDVGGEVRAVLERKLGETVMLRDRQGLAGFAVCHLGPGTEAGGGKCYIKVGAVRPGKSAESNFDRLISACHELARENGATSLVAGVNMARLPAYRRMLARGFRLNWQVLAMHRPNVAGYDRPDVFLFDDWL